MSPVRVSASRRPLSASLRRTHVVWGSLLVAMTAVGGLLLVLEDRPFASRTPAAAVARAPQPRPDLESVLSGLPGFEADRWKGVVIHHSGAMVGSAESLDKRDEARGLTGLGYHFVITNGQGGADGEIQVGYRWTDQLPGAHTPGPEGDYYNRNAVGICLVGDGERRAFTEAQIVSLLQLTAAIQRSCGIEDGQVHLSREVATTPSPGRLFPEAAFRARLSAAQ